MDPFALLTDGAFPRSTLPAHLFGFTPGVLSWEAFNLSKRKSAVAFLFLPPAPGSLVARIVLTRRSKTVRTHKGQIGFAGGRAEAGDISPADTALREMREEIGLDPAKVTVHGFLQPQVALDQSLIIPVVATAAVSEAMLAPAPTEVADIYYCEWDTLTPAAGLRFGFTIFGVRRQSWIFGDPAVWGLTAEILACAEMR